MMAALAAKQMDFASSAAQPFDAAFAHDFAAMQALISAAGPRVAGTNQGTVGENHRRRRSDRELKARNRNFEIRGFSKQFDVAQTQGTAFGKLPGRDALAVNKSAVCGIAIANLQRIAGHLNLAMRRGNGWMIDLEIVRVTASEPVYAQSQLQDPALKPFRGNE